MPEVNFEQIALKLGKYFKPTSPIQKDALFQGRKLQVRQVIDAVNQTGLHAILYGERGVGKTSLGHSLATKLRAVETYPVISALVSCDSSDDYSSIWAKVFDELREHEEGKDEEHYGSCNFTPNEVRKRLEPISKKGILYVIIDEFDKITDDRTTALIADTIKLLSDRAVDATLIIIGVADDVTGLIKGHESIQRCLAQIPMKRMPREELEDIISHGLSAAEIGMSIDPAARDEITGLSKGLPTYTHLLSLNAARAALDAKRLKISTKDVQAAIHLAVNGTQQESIRANYDKATYSARSGTLFCEVLLACAVAVSDEFGRFQPTDICEPLTEITRSHKPFTTDRFSSHLKQFCEDKRAAVLEPTGFEYRPRYRFSDPLMQPFVIMRGVSGGLISEEKLRALIERDARYPLFNPQI